MLVGGGHAGIHGIPREAVGSLGDDSRGWLQGSALVRALRNRERSRKKDQRRDRASGPSRRPPVTSLARPLRLPLVASIGISFLLRGRRFDPTGQPLVSAKRDKCYH